MSALCCRGGCDRRSLLLFYRRAADRIIRGGNACETGKIGERWQMAATNRKLYIKAERSMEVTKHEVTLGDVLSMECTDQDIVTRLTGLSVPF